MTAEQARQSAEDIEKEQYESEYNLIMQKITTEVNKGNYELTLDFYISSYSNRKLKENKYNVTYIVEENNQTKINW